MSSKVTSAVVAALILGFSGAPAHADEALFLDAYEASNDGFAGPVQTQQPLTPNKLYFATVDGTLRYSRPGVLNNPNYTWCPGSIENVAITYPSTAPAAVNDVAFADAESVFALRVFKPNISTCPKLTYHNTALQFDLGGTAPTHIEPAGGPFAAPVADHTYNYVLRGQGSVAQFAFRLRDRPTSDNAGKLRIRLTAATAEDCKKGGWREFVVNGEQLFKNQGDCVSNFVTQGRNEPAGPGAS